MQVCVRHETASGQSLWELSLEFLSERITVRELLRERVHHEVREFNRQQDRLVFHGLGQPEGAERTLNGRCDLMGPAWIYRLPTLPKRYLRVQKSPPQRSRRELLSESRRRTRICPKCWAKSSGEWQ